MSVKIFHNPRCGKSRKTLEIIRSHGLEPEVIEYLKMPPSMDQIRELLAQLELPASAIIRKNEEVYKQKYGGQDLSEEQYIQAMVADPILIERPIVSNGKTAMLGRPPENVLKILDKSTS